MELEIFIHPQFAPFGPPLALSLPRGWPADVASPESVSLIEAVEEVDVKGGVNGTVSDVRVEEEVEAVEAPGTVKSKVKKTKKDDDDSEDNRFKLRNGREVFEEKAYLVGVELKSDTSRLFDVEESLKELEQLADTAGLKVVGSTSQKLASPNPKTYIGSGKVAEIKTAIHALDVGTVIFDDELSAGQLRNLEKALGGAVRVCDRTALILDIFNQRAATHEAFLQANFIRCFWMIPFYHGLQKCQSGGQVKGMGEKQIEVDKRILRTQININYDQTINLQVCFVYQMAYISLDQRYDTCIYVLKQYHTKTLLWVCTIGVLKKELETVRKHRKQYRNRRTVVPVPVISLVAAFRATLEEISESSLLVHNTGISHPLADQQSEAVEKVLSELDISTISKLIVDKASNPHEIKLEAAKRDDVVCISALTGEGLDDFCSAIQEKLKDIMVWIEALVPFDKGELLNTIHKVGMVEKTEYTENGTVIKAHVPLRFAQLLTPLRQLSKSAALYSQL
uniref:Uncharacterized protein n=1 Tax=Kalanchoe fedtschenkoi TaxID=63787 RepID=A0A7N1A3Z5_KALFE